ncbi:hypothetical protein R84B8_00584 [Treponema sp. R8-4-B8]
MRKPLTSRIIVLTALYCVIFCLLVILQFSNRGNFSISAGAMTVKGRYLQKSQPTEQKTEQETEQEAKEITGGVKVFYGGLDFSLKEERGKGLTLTNANGVNTPVNPLMMTITDNSAHFILPGGTTLTFSSIDSAKGQELHIDADFEGDVSEVTIPIVPRRSSIVRDAEQLGIMYGGSRFVFSSLGHELENGYVSLSKDSSFISYRSRGKQRAFDPEDYIIAQVSNYDSILKNWQNTSYAQWNQNAASLQSEDDIIAYGAQALSRGNYPAAIGSISRDFINSPRHSFRSAAFVGGMTSAYSSFASYENEKNNLITRLIRERSLNILKEEHILDFLFTRSNLVMANEVIDIIINASPDQLVSDHCPGLLEIFYDIKRWRPEANNPIEHLTDQMLSLISDNLNHDPENDAVYASSSESNNSEFSMRLGKALVFWADATKNTEWSGIGRSLILSAVANGNAGRLHNILNPTDYYPRATWLTNEGHWTWTVSPSARASYIDSNLNITVSFPAGLAHFLIIRGVRPFNRIQIHGMDWRTDSQFERYDSSGWLYYPSEQILILKIKHRVTVESVRIIYRVYEPPPVTNEASETEGIFE